MLICPKCYAGPHALMGHEEPEVYDGVLWWHCMNCCHAWHNWPADNRRAVVADSYVRTFLAGHTAAEVEGR